MDCTLVPRSTCSVVACCSTGRPNPQRLAHPDLHVRRPVRPERNPDQWLEQLFQRRQVVPARYPSPKSASVDGVRLVSSIAVAMVAVVSHARYNEARSRHSMTRLRSTVVEDGEAFRSDSSELARLEADLRSLNSCAGGKDSPFSQVDDLLLAPTTLRSQALCGLSDAGAVSSCNAGGP